MKRLALLLAAVVACVLFTACPDSDEPVVIPDGTYEETAAYKAFIQYPDTSVVIIDTIMSAIVDIIDGGFNYHGMCTDTFGRSYTSSAALICYHSHFIYCEDAYCPYCIRETDGDINVVDSTVRLPAYVTEDGFVLVQRPVFIGILCEPTIDTAYERKFRISQDGGKYMFNQEHHISFGRDWVPSYITSHTLRPLSNQ